MAENIPTKFVQPVRPVRRFYEFGEFRLEPAERRLLRGGQPIPLTPKAFDTLLLLVQRNGHLVEKEEFIKEVWEGQFVGDDSLARNIAVLRKVLGDGARDHKYIETVSKRGYRFIAHLEENWEEEAEHGASSSRSSPAPRMAEPGRPWMIMPRMLWPPIIATALVLLAFIWIAFVQ